MREPGTKGNKTLWRGVWEEDEACIRYTHAHMHIRTCACMHSHFSKRYWLKMVID